MVESIVKKKYGTECMLKNAGSGSSREACEERTSSSL